jgi:hypothetical protein
MYNDETYQPLDQETSVADYVGTGIRDALPLVSYADQWSQERTQHH